MDVYYGEGKGALLNVPPPETIMELLARLLADQMGGKLEDFKCLPKEDANIQKKEKTA